MHNDFRIEIIYYPSALMKNLFRWFRLENEHLNNAGKFRAVKSVPLPFHEVDEED
jgi:hypothetical protein